jgi:spore photoproduct lyase
VRQAVIRVASRARRGVAHVSSRTCAYADLDAILAGVDAYVGTGAVTSGTEARGHEGTTFEASCYTDPLGIEHVTGSLAAAITHVGTHDFDGPVQLRATTKFGWCSGRPARR